MPLPNARIGSTAVRRSTYRDDGFGLLLDPSRQLTGRTEHCRGSFASPAANEIIWPHCGITREVAELGRCAHPLEVCLREEGCVPDGRAEGPPEAQCGVLVLAGM
jgi:hypothetical protein